MLVALVVGAVVIGVSQVRAQQMLQRDDARKQTLQSLQRAQELFFDHNHRYGTWEELVTGNLLRALPRDPESGMMFELYRTSQADEWCTWVSLEGARGSYMVQNERGSKVVHEAPYNIISCESY